MATVRFTHGEQRLLNGNLCVGWKVRRNLYVLQIKREWKRKKEAFLGWFNKGQHCANAEGVRKGSFHSVKCTVTTVTAAQWRLID